jgi:hypothetical protein
MMSTGQSYVWYAGYGSNLCKKRFLCYILGGKFKWGGSDAKGCTDKSLPKANKQISIPYRLYFAKSSPNWSNGAVAFINPNKELNENNWTLGRIWKITCEQYEEVRVQEGKSWYNEEIYLREEDEFPIRTITNKEFLTPYNQPCEGYLKTIALGLKETYNLTNEEISEYLMKKGNFIKADLINIIELATSCNTSARD